MKQQNRSWPALIGFFVVTALSWSLVFAAIFVGATAIIAGGESVQASDEQLADVTVPSQGFSGVITDTEFGPKHSPYSKQSAPECARTCVRNGSRYTIVDGDKKYEVSGNLAGFDDFAGQRVKVSGSLDGNTIKVMSIEPASAN